MTDTQPKGNETSTPSYITKLCAMTQAEHHNVFGLKIQYSPEMIKAINEVFHAEGIEWDWIPPAGAA